MAFNLPFATLIGYSSRGDFFGEDTARWRTVQTVTIEGIMNPTQVNAMATNGSDLPTSVNTFLGHSVSINGVGVSNSKLISLEFPASENHTEFHDGKAKYVATYEVYIAPASSTFFGISFNDLKDLEEFSEEVSFELSEDNTYSATLDMTVKYAGGASGITAARTLRNAVWGSTPAGIPTSMGGNGVNIWTQAGHWHQTEVHDTATNSCNFSQTRKLLPGSLASTYSAKIDTSLSIQEDGIIEIVESGEIHGQRTTAAYSSVSSEMDNARNGLTTELAAAYARCLAVYNAWKNVSNLTTSETLVLSTQYSDKSVSHDEQAAKISYSISYTNNPNFESSGYVFESKILRTDEGTSGHVINYTEEAEIKQYGRSGLNSNSYGTLYTALNTKIASANSRLAIAYPEILIAGAILPRIVSKKTSIKPVGKTASFSIKHVRDLELLPFNHLGGSGTDHWSIGGVKILRLEKEFNTSGGVSKKEWYNPPNNPVAGPGRIGGEFLHVGNDMVEPSTRKVIYTGQIERNKSGGALQYGPTVTTLMQNLSIYLKQDALRAYTEHWVAMDPVFWNKYYYSSFSWTFKSTYEFTATLEMKFIVPNGSISSGYFWQHSDNTQIIS